LNLTDNMCLLLAAWCAKPTIMPSSHQHHSSYLPLHVIHMNDIARIIYAAYLMLIFEIIYLCEPFDRRIFTLLALAAAILLSHDNAVFI